MKSEDVDLQRDGPPQQHNPPINSIHFPFLSSIKFALRLIIHPKLKILITLHLRTLNFIYIIKQI